MSIVARLALSIPASIEVLSVVWYNSAHVAVRPSINSDAEVNGCQASTNPDRIDARNDSRTPFEVSFAAYRNVCGSNVADIGTSRCAAVRPHPRQAAARAAAMLDVTGVLDSIRSAEGPTKQHSYQDNGNQFLCQ